MTAPAGGIRVDLTLDGSKIAPEAAQALQKQLQPIIAQATKSVEGLDSTLKKVGANSGLKDVITQAGRTDDALGKVMKSTNELSRGVEKYADTAKAAYKKVADATKEVERQEKALEERRKSGNGAWIKVQAEQVKQAKAAEAKAVRDAAAAHSEYERAARGGSGSMNLSDRFKGAAGVAVGAGKDAATGFAEGFAGSAALMRIGAAGGPVGIALAAAAGLGYLAGKMLVDQIEKGMASLRVQDTFQARLGIDPANAAKFGRAAGESYAQGWGDSIEANLSASQFAVQGGLLNRAATEDDIEAVTEKLQVLSNVMGKDVSENARAAGQLIRGGLATDANEAFDILIGGFQKGNDIAGDWLDTVTEYSTQFRKLGIDGPEAIGLIQQGLQGAARDSDVVADSFKEFSIRAVDGSKLTAEGFKALGFNADDMARRFALGGDTARDALGEVLRALKQTDDPMQQKLAWQALFGTQWEDLGDAVDQFDLKSAAALGDMKGASDEAKAAVNAHADEWGNLGRSIDTTFGKLQKWLADTDVGKFISTGLPKFINDSLFEDPTSAANAALDAAVKAARERNALPPGMTAGDAQRARRGLPPLTPNLPVQGDRIPIIPDSDQQKTLSDKERRDQIAAGLDPSLWKVDLDTIPGAPGQPPMQVTVQNLPSTGLTGIPGIPGSLPGSAGGFPWDAVAQAESSGNWSNRDTGNNGHFGGLQFSPETWLAFGGGQFAQNPADASREQQIEIANRTAFTGWNGVAPQGLGAWEVITKGLVPGVTVNTPPTGPGGGIPGGIPGLPDAHGAHTQIAYMTLLAQRMGLNLTSGKNDHIDDGLNHPKGLAGDFAIPGMNDSDPKKRAFAEFLAQNFGDLLNELIYSDPGFSSTISMGKGYQYDAGTLADHRNHVHASVSDANAPEFIRRLTTILGGGIPSAGIPGGFGQNMYATNGPTVMDPTTGQMGYFQVDQQAVLRQQQELQQKAEALEDARRERVILEHDNLATETELEEARRKERNAGWDLDNAKADLAEKQRGSFKSGQAFDYNKLPYGHPMRVMAGVLGGIGVNSQDIGAILGAAGQPMGQVAGDAAAAVAGFPLPGPMGMPGTPTAPSTDLNQLAREGNPLFWAQAAGINVPDYSRRGGGPSAQDLMVNTGPPTDAMGRMYSDTAALIDRTFTNLDAAEKARHDQVMTVLNEVRDKLSKDLLAPVVKQGVADGMGAMGDGVTAALGTSLGQAAAPPIASAVAGAMPSGSSGGGNPGAQLVNTAASTAANVASMVTGPIPAFASGGGVSGGIAGKDSVPAMLMPKEWVLTTDEVTKMGGFSGVERFLSGLHRTGGIRHMATGGGVDVSSTVGAEWFGVSQVPILGAIVNLLVAVLLKVIGVQVEARDTLSEISADFRDFRGDFKAFDAQGRLMNDTSGLVDRSSTNEQTAADERIRILKQVLEGLLNFIIEKIIVPIGKAVANTMINIGAQLTSGAISGGLGAAFPGGSVVGGIIGSAVSSAITAAGSATVDIVAEVGTILAESLINVGLDAIGSLFQSYLPDLTNLFFGGGLAASIFDPIGHGITGLLGGLGMAVSGLVGGLASLVPGLPFDDGGVAVGPGLMPKKIIRPERVLSPNQTVAFEQLPSELRELVGALKAGGNGGNTTSHHVDVAPGAIVVKGGGEQTAKMISDFLMSKRN